MKGLSTWIWIMGGIVISMIVLTVFFTIFSRFTIDKHKQDSLQSFYSMIVDINILCNFKDTNSILKTITLSDLTKTIYASDDYEMIINDQKTSGKNICLNFTNEIVCKPLECEITINDFSTEKPLIGLINKITGNIGYENYQVKVFREDDKVHVIIQPTIEETTTTSSTITSSTISVPATPRTITLKSSRDTYISMDYPTINYEGSNIKIGYKNKNKGLIQFDLSSISQGSTINSATFSLYTEGWSRGGADLSTGVYRIKRGWNEDQATWTKATSTDNWGSSGCSDTSTDRYSAPDDTTTVNALRQWFSWDVTNSVQVWVNDPSSNHGLILFDPSTDTDIYYFTQSEGDSINNRPKLIIDYTPSN